VARDNELAAINCTAKAMIGIARHEAFS
jgi:hypothetical protein